jgi:hypothetical protein
VSPTLRSRHRSYCRLYKVKVFHDVGGITAKATPIPPPHMQTANLLVSLYHSMQPNQTEDTMPWLNECPCFNILCRHVCKSPGLCHLSNPSPPHSLRSTTTQNTTNFDLSKTKLNIVFCCFTLIIHLWQLNAYKGLLNLMYEATVK